MSMSAAFAAASPDEEEVAPRVPTVSEVDAAVEAVHVPAAASKVMEESTQPVLVQVDAASAAAVCRGKTSVGRSGTVEQRSTNEAVGTLGMQRRAGVARTDEGHEDQGGVGLHHCRAGRGTAAVVHAHRQSMSSGRERS